MDAEQLEAIINAVVKELQAAGLTRAAEHSQNQPVSATGTASQPAQPLNNAAVITAGHPADDLVIDLPDPTAPAARSQPGVNNPEDAEGLTALMSTTSARIGVGRAGARVRTRSLLLFQSDLAVTQDALMRDVDAGLLGEFNLFRVQTRVTAGKQEYLLRPDLGRALSEEAKILLSERCIKNPDIQLCVGDGLSAAAIEANLRKIFPVLQSGCKTAGLSFGTPFFIQHCRVGVMNDIGDLLMPRVLILLIGERPGLGRAESMSAYMAYQPRSGHTDAERDVVCNIYDNGGTNPLEAGAYVLQVARKMIQYQASGIQLKLLENTAASSQPERKRE